MKKKNSKTGKMKYSPMRNRMLISVCVVLLLSGSLIIGYAVRASNRHSPGAAGQFRTLSGTPGVQSNPQPRNELLSKLAGNPEPDSLRRRLGRRFLFPGKEVSIISGTLTVGAESHPVSISRSQQADGESTAVAFNGGSSSLSWNSQNGAMSGASQATTSDRSLVERLTLDSPDQFILAQLRGASYYAVAQNVVPAGAGDNYTGPVWDVVRVGEPGQGGTAIPKSPWRMYYVNSATGLIDRVISREDGLPVMAEFSNWTEYGGEISPGRIVWTRDGQVVMELVVSNIGFSSTQ